MFPYILPAVCLRDDVKKKKTELAGNKRAASSLEEEGATSESSGTPIC